MRLRDLAPEDWPAVARIYADGIATGNATFETGVPEWDAFDATRLPDHRFVAEADGGVVGWIAGSRVSSRAVYAGVVEHSVYVDESVQARGVGRALLERFVASTEAAGIWTIQTSIFPENEPSLRLHARVGFEVVGPRRRIAQLHGIWRDTLLLERRSPVVG